MKQILVANGPTMSSREIAELTGKQHKNVMRDICGMLHELKVDTLSFEHIYYDSRNRKQLEFMLDREHTDCLLTGYSSVLRMNVIKRWKELEAKTSQAAVEIPQTLSQALRLAADQAEQIEQQKQALAIAAPKVEFVDQYVESTGSMTFRQVAKLLKAKEHALRQMLQDQKVMYKLGGEWTAYQNHIEAGRFEVKTGTAQHNDHAYTTARFTPKGVEYVSKLWRDMWLPKMPERASAEVGKSMEKSQ